MLVPFMHSTVLDASQYVIQEDFGTLDATITAPTCLLLARTLGITIMLGDTLSRFGMVFGPSLARHSWVDRYDGGCIEIPPILLFTHLRVWYRNSVSVRQNGRLDNNF
jgi:hypothetical protein